MRRLGTTLLLVAVLAAPASAQSPGEITPEDVAAADAERRSVASRLAEATAEYDANVTRGDELLDELRRLSVELDVRQGEIGTTRVEAARVIRDRYVAAGDRGMVAMFDAASLSDLTTRSQYLDLLAVNDTAVLKRLTALRESYRDQQERLRAAAEEQDQVTAMQELLATRILGELEAANAAHDTIVNAYAAQEEERIRREEEERRRREEEKRRNATTTTTTTTAPVTSTTVAPTTTVPPPTTTTEPPPGTTVPPSTTTLPPPETTTTTTTPPPPPPPGGEGRRCPVDGASSFVDTWGAPRSGGRRHQGVDMIAVRGTPLVALEAGTVIRMSNRGLGGITVWLRSPSGDEYYYAHLDAWEPGVGVGTALAAGDALGTVGNTGNARYTVPHLHFEFHPDGGGAINPYPLVAELCA